MGPSRARRAALGRYVAVLAVGNLVWELAHMPLYTLWRTGSALEVASAAVHCVIGDMLIGAASLAGSLMLFGGAGWPRFRFLRVAVPTTIVGLGVTILVERLATASGIWTYSDLMPVLPGLGTGLAPLAQWIVVPTLAFAAARLPLGGKPQAVPAQEARDHSAMAVTASAAEPGHLAHTTGRAS